MLHLKRRFYEARLTAYEAISDYEAALRAMKRSLFRLHSPFLPQAKMVGNEGKKASIPCRSKFAVNHSFLPEKCLIWLVLRKTKNIL